MDHSSKEGASRENKRTARQDILAGNGNGGDSISIDTQVSHLTFKEVQSRCSGEGVLHRAAIGLSISLSPGPLDRRAPATVQQAKLYARLISHPPDQAVERINQRMNYSNVLPPIGSYQLSYARCVPAAVPCPTLPRCAAWPGLPPAARPHLPHAPLHALPPHPFIHPLTHSLQPARAAG